MLNNKNQFFLRTEDRRNISGISHKSEIGDIDDNIYRNYKNNMPNTIREKKEISPAKKPDDNVMYELTIPVK
jgi:hypothetical protein